MLPEGADLTNALVGGCFIGAACGTYMLVGGYVAGFCMPFILFQDVDSENFFHHQVMRPLAIVITALLWLQGVVYMALPPQWPPRSYHVKAPCCETILACTAIPQDLYGEFSCKDGWQVNWPGFFDTHNSGDSGRCSEMRAYLADQGF